MAKSIYQRKMEMQESKTKAANNYLIDNLKKVSTSKEMMQDFDVDKIYVDFDSKIEKSKSNFGSVVGPDYVGVVDMKVKMYDDGEKVADFTRKFRVSDMGQPSSISNMDMQIYQDNENIALTKVKKVKDHNYVSTRILS